MERHISYAIAIGTGIVLVFVVLQIPAMHTLNGWGWDAWTYTVAAVANMNPLELENDVRSQLQQLRAENVHLKAEARDYQRLRDQIGSPPFDGRRTILASTHGLSIDAFGTHFVINRGARDGVILGAPVVAYGSVLIGLISELHEHSAIYQTLYDPTTSLTVEIGDARGLLQGTHYTALRVITIPRDKSIAIGQDIVTVARDLTVPYGLVIGQVAAVVSKEEAAFQEAEVGLSYDPSSLDAVVVVVPP